MKRGEERQEKRREEEVGSLCLQHLKVQELNQLNNEKKAKD